MTVSKKKFLPDTPDVSEEIVLSLHDLFTATLFYTMELAERKLVECTLPQRIALEKKYGTKRQDCLIMELLRDAAKRSGLSLDKFAMSKVETEELPIPPVLTSFEDLIDEVYKKH